LAAVASRFATRAVRFAARANAIAAFHGACESASARAAACSAMRQFAGGGAAPPASARVHGVGVTDASNITCDRCFGAHNAAGLCASSAAFSGGRYARHFVAAHASRHRVVMVLT
jgi:hypothetical protein